ncbi:MAG TPA: hypothetical protein DEB40_10760 [Elusimicrobia bacterium]|nr:hypothetical protein [Elusimicrobiota bacterium]
MRPTAKEAQIQVKFPKPKFVKARGAIHAAGSPNFSARAQDNAVETVRMIGWTVEDRTSRLRQGRIKA